MNPKYTFDLFVIGSSNRFAHAAALAVAEAPAQAYNPLFIYGGTGLGKTHLLQAIGQYVGEHGNGLTARYVTSETFMNDFINSLRDKRIEGFKQRYRTYDVLLVDDVQFLEGKERIQEEFFHTFNTLYEAGKQIVLSLRPAAEGDRDARGAPALALRVGPDHRHPAARPRDAHRDPAQEGEDRPDPRARPRRAHVRRRAGDDEHPRARGRADPRRRLLLAHRPRDDRRARRGRAQGRLPQGQAVEISIRRIQETVSERFGMTISELCSAKRSQAIAYPRQVAMYLSRALTDSSLPKIGKEFGGRDHTTVMHANAKIEGMIREDRSVYNLVQELTARIKQAG